MDLNYFFYYLLIDTLKITIIKKIYILQELILMVGQYKFISTTSSDRHSADATLGTVPVIVPTTDVALDSASLSV